MLEAKHVELEYKTDITDLVTEYDRKVEETLIRELKKKYPQHKYK